MLADVPAFTARAAGDRMQEGAQRLLDAGEDLALADDQPLVFACSQTWTSTSTRTGT